ncbi:immunoglobulin-like domain-containing protein [Georgenia deserti]|uniref:Immunoglobulin-like domain-containing protein n=1 Tax=Georgenia deserti TaxID=2093781 RepID=A0ABW4L066_9MICO
MWRSKRHHGGRRRAAVGTVATAALAGAFLAPPASALDSDQSEAIAEFLAVEALSTELASLVGAESGYPSDPTVNSSTIDAALLSELIGVGVSLPGLPLIGDGSGPALLDLGPGAGAGVLNDYAYAPDPYHATASSGAVTNDGAIDLGAVQENQGVDMARLDATALLGQLGIDGLTDEIVDEVSLGIGALASTAHQTTGSDPTSEYVVSGLEMTVSSPLVGDLTNAVDANLASVSTQLNGMLGPDGTVQQTLNTLAPPPVNVLGLINVNLGAPQVNAQVDLSAVTAGVLQEPLVSDNGLVAIDLTTGDITIDLAQLHGGNLNGLDPNTELLTAEEITQITDTIADLLGQVTGLITDAVTAALLSTEITIDFNPTISGIGGTVSGTVDASITGTLADFLGQSETQPDVDITGSVVWDPPLLPPTTINLGSLTSALEPVLENLIPSIGSALQPVLTTGQQTTTNLVGGTVSGLVNTLDPILDGILADLLSITINAQSTAENGLFTVTALDLTVLPTLDAVDIPLASSSVRVEQLAPALEATPDELNPGGTVTSNISGFPPDSTVTVTYTDSDGNVVGTSEVTLDGTGSGTDSLVLPDDVALGDLTISATDGSGNEATDVVSVVEPAPANTPPTIEGAADTVVEAGSDFDPMAGVTASDLEDGDLTADVTVDGTVDTSTPGEYELTYSVTDSDGATASVVRTVTVAEPPNAAPVIEGADDATVDFGADFDPMAGVTATDPEDGDLTSEITVDGTVDTSTPGEYELTYTVTDSDGDSTTVTRIVTVSEPPNEPPVITGATDTTVDFGAEFDPMAGISATDPEDGDLTSEITVDGTVDTSTPGEYELTYTVTDSDGATATVTRIVTVTEPPNEPPVITGATDTTVDFGTEFDPMAGITATDPEDGDLTSEITVDGTVDTTTPGDYELTYTVTDSDGTTTSVTRVVTVSEPPNEPPVIEGATNVAIEQGTAFDPMAGITATDPEDGDLTSEITVDGTVDTTTPGDYELTYTVTDSDGTTTSVTRVVTVSEPPNEPPVIEGATNVAIEQGTAFDPMAGVTATDPEDGDLTSEITVDGTVDTTTPGEYELTYTVTDSDGATATVIRTVTVSEAAPVNQPPTLEGVADTTVDFGADFDPMAGVTATDPEDGDLTSEITVDGTVDTTTPGEYELTYSVTDSEGETVTATRTVIVSAPPNAPPVIEGATDTTVDFGADFDPMAGITATDPEDGDLTADITVDGTVDTTTPGDYELTYTVTDSDGATSSVTRVVTVSEPPNEPPVIEGAADVVVEQGTAFDPMAGVTATDPEDGDLTADITVDGTVDTTTPGDYELTYSVTDSDGATVTTSRVVTVTAPPNEAPVLEGVASTTVEAGNEFDPMAGVSATDPEDGDLTSEIIVDGSVDTTTPGDYELTYTVTDSAGATTTATRIVTVTEPPNQAPELAGVVGTTVEAGSEFDPMAGVSASDAEDGDLTSEIIVDGSVDTSTPGEYTLTYSVTDSAGATTTATRVVTVTPAPNTAPVLEGVMDTVIEAGTEFDPMAGVSATDAEDGDLTDQIEITGEVDTTTPGDYELTYTVTDSAGATVTATRVVTVTEPEPVNTPPALDGVGSVSVEVGTEFDPMAGVSATDAEDGDLTDQIEITGEVDTTTPGDYELTYSVTDADGATTTATRVVTVTPAPNTAPALDGVVDIAVEQGTVFDPMAGVTASDPEDGDLTADITVDGTVDITTPGEYELTYTVTDSDGATTTAVRTVTVTEAPPANTPPVLEGVSDIAVEQGGEFDPMAGVSATDAEDGDLTSEITVDGTVDTSTPDEYTLTYTVTDSAGATTTATRTVTVTAPPNEAPVLEGVGAVEIPEGAVFDPMAGVSATDAEDGDLTDQIEITGEVDTTTPGEYELTYTVTDSDGATTTAVRTVTVTEAPPANEPPMIEGAENTAIDVGAEFDPMAGVSATDAEDGNLTADITVDGTVDTSTPGDYTLTYTVTDSDGATTSVVRTVTVLVPPNEAPMLEGVGAVEIPEGAVFDPMAGVSATDPEDGDLTDQIEVTGTVDTTTPGDYELTYTVTDSDGATTTATRVVTVIEAAVNTPPVLEGVDSVEVAEGAEFDPMEGVSATDAEDGDLTSEITVDGSVDTTTPGDYELVYSVTDSDGTTVTATRIVTVTADPDPDPVNTAPTLDGVVDATVLTGSAFDPMAGVSAADAEDGDLTSEITVDGTVDTTTPGDYELTYTVTDSGGTTVTATRTVTVVDPEPVNTPPAIDGTADTTVDLGADFDPLAGVSASDPEDGDLTSEITVDGTVDTSTPGDYTLTYSVTDSGGATVTESRIVTVLPAPNSAPILDGVGATMVVAGGEFDPMAGVSATDAEDGDLTEQIEVTGTVDTTTPGDYELTYTVTDSDGATVTTTRVVTVIEPDPVNSPPVLEGVDSVEVAEGAEFDPLEGVSATDAEDGDLTDQIEVTGTVDTTTPGDYELTYTVTDSDGATVTATRIVTVSAPPNEPPVLEGVEAVTVVSGSEFDPMAGVAASDPEDGDLTDQIEVTGTVDTTTPGEYELTYSVTDSAGTTVTVTRVVTVTEPEPVNTPPVLGGVEGTTIEAGSEFDPLEGVSATDAEDGDLTDQIEVTGTVDTTTPGEYELTYTVTDSAGTTVTATRTVVVAPTPNTAPVIEGADSVEIFTGTAFDPMDGVSAADAEDGDLTADITVDGTVDTTTPGDYTLTYSVTDSAGATVTTERVVSVLPSPPVNNAPVIEGADGVTVTAGSEFDPMSGVSATDAEDGDLTADITVDGTVDTTTPGEYQLTYTVTDSAGATVSVTRVVTVEPAPNTAPVLEGIVDTTVEPGSEFDPLEGVSATDAEDGDLTDQIEVTGTVDTTTPGDYELVYTVTDSDGTTVTATRTVTVSEEAAPDNELPVLEGVGAVTLEQGDEFNPLEGVTATDAEDGDLTDQIEVTGTVDTTTPGDYELTYTVTDSAGGTVTVTRTVTVAEATPGNTAPVLEGVGAAQVQEGAPFDPMAGVSATDAEDGDLTDQIEVTGTVDTTTPGDYELTYTVTDSDGTTVTATRVVTVTAAPPVRTAPVLEGVDAVTVVEGEDFDPLAGVSATDAEDGDLTDQIEVTGTVDTTTPGEYELTYTVTDSDGTTVTATRVVTVVEAASNTPPVLDGVGSIEVGEGSEFDPLAGVSATDAEDGDLTDQIEVTGTVDTTTPGDYELTYTVTDSDGATVTVTRTVTVTEDPTGEPNTPPVLEGVGATTVIEGEDFDPLAGVSATDAEDGDLTDQIEVTGTVDTTTPGDYELTYTVTDSGGSTITVTRVVTVAEAGPPNSAPVLEGVGGVEVDEGSEFDPMEGVSATDAEDGDLTDQIETTGEVDTTTPGDYELVYSVTDSAGTTVTVTRVVTVTEATPNTPPVFEGIDEVRVEAGSEFDPLEGVSATDAEDGDLTDQIEVTGTVDTTTPGDYELVYSVTDSAGTTVTTNRVVTVTAANSPAVLEGVDSVTIEAGSEFDPLEGVSATDAEDGDLTDQIEVTGTVDTTTPGEYELTYSVTDSDGATTTVTRIVTVGEAAPPNAPPVLEGVDAVEIPEGAEFDPLEGVTATDPEDGDLTDQIEVTGTVDTSTPGDYELTYRVVDSDGTAIEVTRTVTVAQTPPDNTPPVLEGVGPVEIPEGANFDPLEGVSATDAEDGDLTEEIRVVGMVDTSTPGEYGLTYTVTDSAGSTVTVTRTVTVAADDDQPGPPDDEPSVTVPDTVAPGEDIPIDLGGFTPGSEVEVVCEMNPVIGRSVVTIGADGTGSATCTVPAGASGGTVTVTATDRDNPDLTASATVHVVPAGEEPPATGPEPGPAPAPGPGRDGGLPDTGADATGAALLSAVLLLLGGLALLVRRRFSRT